jgi:hypothetical protein
MTEFQQCGTDACPDISVDCSFSDWEDWSVCSSSFNGVQNRHRHVLTFSSHGGNPCDGHVQEYTSCNKDVVVDPVADAVLTDWTDWTECTKSCDGGTRSRSRDLEAPGEGSDGPLSELGICNTELCCPECDTDVDCVWEDWGEWGACSELCGGGEQKRVREVLTLSKHHGAPCTSQDSLQVTSCNDQVCGGGAVSYCIWSDWSAFSSCTKECGGGTMERTRRLQTSGVPPGDGLFVDSVAVKALEIEAAKLERSVEHANAFLVCLAGVVLAVSVIGFGRRRQAVPATGERLLE